MIDITFHKSEGKKGFLNSLTRVCDEACQAAMGNYQLIILSDRKASVNRIPLSALLALGAVHHHLIEERQRMKVGLILETGEAR